jgi:hypothetical protein
MENKAELEYFKRQRETREQAKEDREKETRDGEVAQFKQWNKQEDKFHLTQAKLRSKIRIKEKRAKPIDLLARCVMKFPSYFTIFIFQIH